LFVFACGDNGSNVTPDASHVDPMTDGGHTVVPRVVAVGADFQTGTGTLSKLEVDNLDVTQNVRAGAASGDPVLRYVGKEVFVINRFGFNNITILDAKTLQLVDQISTGANSNPQDVAVVGQKLYVAALGSKGLLVIDRSTGTKTEIDLATPLGDADGHPDCVSVYAVGTKVFAACSMQTNFKSVLDSKVAVVDTSTDTYVTSATLPYKNPFGFFQRAPEGSTFTGELLIPLVDFGVFGDNTMPPMLATRCVARVSTGATLTVGCAIQNADLGGYPANMSVSADGKTLYLAVEESFTVGKLRAYNLETGTLAPDPIGSSTTAIDVAACPNGDVAVSDSAMNMMGVRVYRGTTERTTSALSIGNTPVATGLICYDANL
jgi:DNA-binding beta-propeller fold protein YncE